MQQAGGVLWWDDIEGQIPDLPTLAGSIAADVAIVGAGYSGLWTAYYLSLLQPEKKIVILEAEQPGFGASGRNGGWCTAVLAGLEHDFEDAAKLPAAR